MEHGLKVLVASTLFVAPAAWGVPFNYDEAVDGDLADPRIGCCIANLPRQTTLTLGIGANQVRGSFEFTLFDDYSYIHDNDPFRVVVPEGLEIERVRFFWEITGAYNVADFVYRFELFNSAGGTATAIDSIVLLNTRGILPPAEEVFADLFQVETYVEDNIPANFLPLGAGVWGFYPGHSGSANATTETYSSFTMNYRVVIDGRNVPEPGPLGLFAFGMAVLLFRRRSAA